MRPYIFNIISATVLSLGVIGGARAANLIDAEKWYLQVPGENYATKEMVTATDAPSGVKSVIKLTVSKSTDPFYQIIFGQALAPAIPQNDRLQLRFWARSSTNNPLRAVVEKVDAPYTAITEIKPTLTPQWKQYTCTGPTPGFGENGIGVKFQVGHQVGTVELAGITLENVGPDPKLAAAVTAVAPDAIKARIVKYRTGELTVTVTDTNGRAVRNAEVRVEQTNHAFLFGCNFFALNPADDSPLEKLYQERFTALFNYGTLPFYWGAFEPQKGEPQYARLDAMAKWCKEHNIATKGHPLVWHEVYPGWAPKNPDEAIPLLRQRVMDIVPHYKGLITYWDVLNEANAASAAANTGEGAWIKRDGPTLVVATALKWAREAGKGSKNTFLYNDFDVSDSNIQLITELKKKNALPDAIGIQSHMHGGTWSLQQLWLTTERFAQFGIPIHYTETTVISGPKRTVDMNNPPSDWVTTTEDEKKQADYVVQFYSILFSHPMMRAITWWDFSDLNAWQGAPAGFLRKDMSPKPVYDRLMNLIRKEWWTNTSATTDARGACATRAFYGAYKVTVTDGQGRTATSVVSFPIGSGKLKIKVIL